jgi:Cupin-like domain
MRLLPQDIDRHDWTALGEKRFRTEYLQPMRPVVLRHAIDHWGAMGKWTPDYFRRTYATRRVTVDGKEWALAELIERIEASSPEHPAPYLRNELLRRWPEDAQADVAPMPACTRPNWLESRVFPSRQPLTYIELYIGGRGAKFPVLHYDGLHTHAFLMQLHGEKEYLALAPDQASYLYPSEKTAAQNISSIDDVEHPDRTRFPLFDGATGIRFKLHPGETLYVPSGWWHTARILSTSITVSINGANSANWKAFVKDYVADVAGYSRWKAALILPYLVMLGNWLEFWD